MAFELPPLPYAFNALEPHIDAQTMEIHHDKHHAAYVNNANAALEKHPEFGKKTLEDLLWTINTVPEDIRTTIRNNAGHANYTTSFTTARSAAIASAFSPLTTNIMSSPPSLLPPPRKISTPRVVSSSIWKQVAAQKCFPRCST